jgi:hypothetical protein
MEAVFNQIKFTDADVVNKDDFIPQGEYNPHKVGPILLHDAGFILAVVFAESLQDALDIAADAGKLQAFEVDDEDMADYPDEEGLTSLGQRSGNTVRQMVYQPPGRNV